MKYVAFILNLPLTLLGIVLALLSVPRKVYIQEHPLTIVIKVRNFWWYTWLPNKTGTRAMTTGHVVQLGPLEQPKDLEHELIHIEQAIREPLIYPALYILESLRHGYRQNKYEAEAYERAGNKYESK